jgi:hypothetical protein
MAERPLTASTAYDDPNTPLHPKRRWSSLLKKLVLQKDPAHKIPKSLVPLTERNLTEFFNPDYCDEHDAFHPVRHQRKVSISEWLQHLP